MPKEYGMGVEYTKEEIDAAFPDFYHVITPKNIVTQGAITIRTRDISGHGTAVALLRLEMEEEAAVFMQELPLKANSL